MDSNILEDSPIHPLPKGRGLLGQKDKAHPDISPPGREPGYRQYFVCDECFEMERRIRHNQWMERKGGV